MTDPSGTDPPPFALAKPTPYPDVNAVLGNLLARVHGALGEHPCGVYLCGSLITGDFDPLRSDVDVLVVTDVDLSAD